MNIDVIVHNLNGETWKYLLLHPAHEQNSLNAPSKRISLHAGVFRLLDHTTQASLPTTTLMLPISEFSDALQQRIAPTFCHADEASCFRPLTSGICCTRNCKTSDAYSSNLATAAKAMRLVGRATSHTKPVAAPRTGTRRVMRFAAFLSRCTPLQARASTTPVRITCL